MIFSTQILSAQEDPWANLCMSCVEAKILADTVPLQNKNFPWIPVISGVTGIGILTYIITKDKNDPSDCSFTATAQATSSTCQLSNGGIHVTVNPQDAYSYTWSNGATTSSLQNILPGNYSLTITKTGTDCNRIIQATVPNQDQSFDATFITADAHCGTQEGNIQINVNPTGPYTFIWSNGATTSAINNLSQGIYSVTISAGGTCTRTFTTTIHELPAEFDISSTSTPSQCGQSGGVISLQVTPAGDYSYTWSNGSTTSQITGLTPGQYSVTVSITGTTCSKNATITVEEFPPTFEITSTSTPSGCGLSDGAADVIINPLGEYIYAWSNGSTTSSASGLSAGDYNVTVTIFGTQCSKTATVTVGELPALFTLTLIHMSAACGQSDGTAIVNVSPPGSYVYSWSNGSTEAQATNLAAGTYQLTVTLAGTNCSKDTIVTIGTLPPTFMITSATTPSGCIEPTGTAIITVDPKGVYTYIWSNGMTGSQVSGLAAGEYTVTVTILGTTCSSTSTVTVEQSGIHFTGTISSDGASCGVADGSATITVNPAGEYTYLWSDQQTGPAAMQLVTGEYSVVVTDMNGCSLTFSTSVDEDPAEYISIASTTPGTCISGGDITFTLSQPVPLGSGPLILNISGPEGPTQLSLSPGMYPLSSFTNVIPGNYTITVYNEAIGTSCTETVDVLVTDNTPTLNAEDDFYTTPGGMSVFENALDNDSGFNIQMTSVTNIIGGDVIFNSDGSFTFTPDQGFSGDATFTYVVTDACGTTATGVVTIIVEQVTCDFTIQMTTTPASCGLSDGNIFIEVNEPGNYSYFWDTGVTGPALAEVPAGTYTVTIEENDLGCNLEFTISVSENPADYISNIIVTQPSCGTPGEISFTASTPGVGQMIMTIEHPNGNDVFFIDEGTITLSDYIEIVEGAYFVEVSNSEAGPDCVESLEAEINPSSSVQIMLANVIPPSSPSAMDGIIVISAIMPGVLPYTVFLNGTPYSTANQHTFQILGLGAGNYTVQVRDAAGCFSNILIVNVPLPGIILSFGTALIHHPYDEQNPEHSTVGSSQQWSSGIIASLQYFIGSHAQELQIVYSPSDQNRFPDKHNGYMEMQYLAEMKRLEWKQIRIAIDAGLGIRAPGSWFLKTTTTPEPQFWSISTSVEYKLKHALKFETHLSLRGWASVEKPVIYFSVIMPMGRFD